MDYPYANAKSLRVMLFYLTCRKATKKRQDIGMYESKYIWMLKAISCKNVFFINLITVIFGWSKNQQFTKIWVNFCWFWEKISNVSICELSNFAEFGKNSKISEIMAPAEK